MKTRSISTALAVLVVLGASAAQQAQSAPITWSTNAPVPTPRGAGQVVVANGKILALGGRTGGPNGITTASVECFDSRSNAWTAHTPMSVPRHSFAAAAWQDSILVAGGVAANDEFTPTVELYRHDLNQWSRCPNLPTPRGDLRMAALNGRFYAIGGVVVRPGNPPVYTKTNLVEVYDPVLQSWSTRAPMPTSRSAHELAVLRGKLYAVGGAREDQVLTTVEVYDPDKDSWSAAAPLLQPRSDFAMCSLSDRLVIITDRVVEMYNPDANAWTRQSGPVLDSWLNKVVPLNGTLHVVGGWQGQWILGTPIGTHWQLNAALVQMKVRRQSQGVEMGLFADSDTFYEIQASTNLPLWETALQLNGRGAMVWTPLPTGENLPQQFYRCCISSVR